MAIGSLNQAKIRSMDRSPKEMQRRVLVRLRAAVLALAVVATACATTANLKKARGTGDVREFEANWKEMWEATLKSVPANGLQLDRANEYERWIVATHLPTQTGSGRAEDEVALEANQGERIGIFLDSIGPGQWAVEVVTMKRFALALDKQEWFEEIFWVIEHELDDENRIRIPARAFRKPPRR